MRDKGYIDRPTGGVVNASDTPTPGIKQKTHGSTSFEPREGPDIGPIVYQGRGNRSNEIPGTWH